jgi:hypothetical protein
MNNFNKFQLRKDIFDYLRVALPMVDVVPEHPTGTGATKPKVVVTVVRDPGQNPGWVTQEISNPEIQLTLYTVKELDLTKPTGLIYQVENLMKVCQPSWQYPNFHQVRNLYVGFVQDYLLYSAYIIYRFYSSENY